MASSTIMPIDSASPASESTFIEYPTRYIPMNAPITDTGMEVATMKIERQLLRNMNSTSSTNIIASIREFLTIFTASRMYALWSYIFWNFTPKGPYSFCNFSIS